MVGTTMADASVKAVVDEHFIPVLVDADVETELMKQLEVSRFPTVLWVAPDGEVIERSLLESSVEDVRLDALDTLEVLRER